MSGAAQIDIQGFSGEAVDGDALARVQPLWEAMFDHHAHIGGAGLPMITRADTWRHRVNHYTRVFAGERNPALWLAFQHGKPVGYAVAYEYAECGEWGMLLESLSVLPETRGLGVGGRLMDAVDAHARAAGVRHAAVEVLGGNARARALYVRRGYAPHTESWMRTAPPTSRCRTRRT